MDTNLLLPGSCTQYAQAPFLFFVSICLPKVTLRSASTNHIVTVATNSCLRSKISGMLVALNCDWRYFATLNKKLGHIFNAALAQRRHSCKLWSRHGGIVCRSSCIPVFMGPPFTILIASSWGIRGDKYIGVDSTAAPRSTKRIWSSESHHAHPRRYSSSFCRRSWTFFNDHRLRLVVVTIACGNGICTRWARWLDRPSVKHTKYFWRRL